MKIHASKIKNGKFVALIVITIILCSFGCKTMFYSPPELPIFPTPYPRPSAVDIIPKNVISSSKTFEDVNNILSSALNKCKYYRKSYFQIPNGFALMTQLEQINKDGTSKPENERWIYGNYKKPIFSLSDYIQSLFVAEPGYYRSIVFLVSDKSFNSSNEVLSDSKATEMLNDGMLILPNEIFNNKINDNYFITALIYEFKKLESSKTAELLLTSNLQGRTHLEKSKILNYLK